MFIARYSIPFIMLLTALSGCMAAQSPTPTGSPHAASPPLSDRLSQEVQELERELPEKEFHDRKPVAQPAQKPEGACVDGALIESADQADGTPEPLLRVAQAYLKNGQFTLALYFAERASMEAGAAGQAASVLEYVKAARTGNPPPDLHTASAVTLKDELGTLHLYPQRENGCFGTIHTLQAEDSTGRTDRLPVGPLPLLTSQTKFESVSLPGGVHGYWLKVPRQIGAYVGQAVPWMLFTYVDGRLDQVIFRRNATVRDWIRHTGDIDQDWNKAPKITGDRIHAEYRDTASGTRLITEEWRLSTNLHVATLVSEESTVDGKLVAAGQRITMRPRDRLGVTREEYTFSYDVDERVVILRKGQPVLRTELKPGQEVQLTLRDGKAVRIEILL